jgi:hypothetical protein
MTQCGLRCVEIQNTTKWILAAMKIPTALQHHLFLQSTFVYELLFYYISFMMTMEWA